MRWNAQVVQIVPCDVDAAGYTQGSIFLGQPLVCAGPAEVAQGVDEFGVGGRRHDRLGTQALARKHLECLERGQAVKVNLRLQKFLQRVDVQRVLW